MLPCNDDSVCARPLESKTTIAATHKNDVGAICDSHSQFCHYLEDIGRVVSSSSLFPPLDDVTVSSTELEFFFFNL